MAITLPEVEAAVVCLITEVGGCWLPCGCGLRTRDARLREAGGRICDERTLLIRGLPIAKADGLVAQPSCESLKKKISDETLRSRMQTEGGCTS